MDHFQNCCTFTLCNYAENEDTIQMIWLFKEPLFNAQKL